MLVGSEMFSFSVMIHCRRFITSILWWQLQLDVNINLRYTFCLLKYRSYSVA